MSDEGDAPEIVDPDEGSERSQPDPASADTDDDTSNADGHPSDADDHSSDADDQADFPERTDRAMAAIQSETDGLDPEKLLEYTTDRRDLDPTVRYLWGLWTTVGVLILTAVLTFAIGALDLPLLLGIPVFVVLLVLGLGWVVLRYRLWVYQVRSDSLYLERGVYTHRQTHVPYVRIQHVDTSRSPLERWLGLSTLVVYTAGSRGADVSIPGLKPDEARDLQGRVKDLAIEAEGGDAL